eukprot:TRINITY_DN11020_c0_g1_i1.p1 TRINITY_DN11020_c0_g1~~TRINITY_DN11020_c0_g1_i1.p1  ORF type:complete len:536 (+),score=120.13 TRINITY_DN11020_c0_g1_i1:463-2070(+)
MFIEAEGTVEIAAVSLGFTASPTMDNPADYKNHFDSSDELLNRIWYGCAYTVQMCSINPSHGRQWGPPSTPGWNNGVLIGSGNTLLVDGAKRDRTVWPGDMGVSSATAFATLGDTESSQNSLDTLYALQASSGQLPYVGPQVFCQKPWGESCGTAGAWNSDTYHLWALVGTWNVFSYTQHTTGAAWIAKVWAGYKQAVQHSLGKLGSNGLMNVDQSADWQRTQGGYNVAANALLAQVLNTGSILGTTMNDTVFSQKCATAAAALTASMNAELWDQTRGAFMDSPNSTLHPQDGNSLVLWFNLTTPARAALIAQYLQSNWSPIGAISPEYNTYDHSPGIGNFPGSMEVLGHAASGRADLSMELIKRQWGYMIDSPNSTQSTFWEGFLSTGQFGFQGIYMSHAHGWAAGPAAALSFHVLGLSPDLTAQGIGASSYIVAPQFGHLAWCNGSLHFGDGKVHVSWSVSGQDKYTVVVDALLHPLGRGRVGLPLTGSVVSPVVSVHAEVPTEAELGEHGLSSERVWYTVQGGRTRFEVGRN